MAALRPCPSARVAVASVASRIGSSSRRRTLPVLSLRRRGGLSLKHGICAAKDAVDQPNQPDPEEEEEAAAAEGEGESKTVNVKEIEKFAEEYAAKLGVPYDKNKMEESDDMFYDEEHKIDEHIWEMLSSNPSILHVEATLMSVELCWQARRALHLSSIVMYNATFRLGQPSEISMPTIEQTVRMCTSTFVKTAEDTYHGKVKRATIRSFLGALGGLAAISHVLLLDALDTVNDILLKDGKPKHSPCLNVETARREFQQNLNNLKQNVKTKTLPLKTSEILNQIVCPATKLADEFVTTMVLLLCDAQEQAPDEYKWRVPNSSRPGGKA